MLKRIFHHSFTKQKMTDLSKRWFEDDSDSDIEIDEPKEPVIEKSVSAPIVRDSHV
jgi:hypothetical protein